jgi:hypothetical protein
VSVQRRASVSGDEVVSGPRGRLSGSLRAVIHSPDSAERWLGVGEYLRFRTCPRAGDA